MNPTIDVKVDQFNAAIADMQQRLGGTATKRQIIDFEVGKILEKTLAGTKTATAASINNSVKRTNWTTYPANWNGGGGKRYLLTNRYPNSLWGKIQGQMSMSLARKVAAKGWARKSWFALALKIGVQIDDKGSNMAKVSNHEAADNVTYRRDENGGNYMLVIANTSPLLRWADSARAFFAAVAGRTGFYKQNLAHGVFNDLAQVSRKYPGLSISVPPRAD